MLNNATTGRRFGLVVPQVGTSMWKWAARDGRPGTYRVTGATAQYSSIEDANKAIAICFPGRRDVYAADITHLVSEAR